MDANPYATVHVVRIRTISLLMTNQQSIAESDQSERTLAEAWARSTGLVDIPAKPHQFKGWICFILAFVGFVPAIIYYFWCQSTADSYSEAMNKALRTWKANGSPDPYHSKNIFPTIAPPLPKNVGTQELSSKLEELFKLKEKGILTEEEFLAAKKKTLGI